MSRTATPADVLSGAARWCVVEGDATEVVRALPLACIDALVTDPPAGIAFMGAEWDGAKGGRAQWVAWLAEVLGHARAATRDGGRALVWSLPRTSHWTGCAVEDAGWSIETTVTHLFGCLTPDTEILVNGEWVSYDKATAGNLALCYDAGRDSLAWQPISELVVYDHHQHLYRLAGERTDQLVTRGHRCPVYRDGRIVFLSADEVAEGGTAEVPVVEDVQGMLAAIPVPQRPRGPFEGVRGRVPGDAATGEAEDGAPGLRDVRVGVHAEGQQAARLVPVLLGGMLREVACGEPGDHRAHARGGPQGQSGLDGRVEGVVPHEDDRAGQSGVEGRRHAGEFQGELSARRVRALSAGVLCDGAAGRLDSGTQVDGGAGHRSHAHDSGERASRQPRPAGQSSGEPDAVREQLGSQAVRASRFAAPDLVRVEPARHDGVVWCVRVPTGAFVARRNGKVFITGNTGWPKGKSQLKPLAETWWLARTGRTTALNIEACRVGAQSTRRENRAPMGYAGSRPAPEGYATGSDSGRYPPNVVLSHAPGCRCVGERRVRGGNDPRRADGSRAASPTFAGLGEHAAGHAGYADPDGTELVEAWECVEGCPVRELDAQSGELTSGKPGVHRLGQNTSSAYGSESRVPGTPMSGHGDTGTAARFFPQFPADPLATTDIDVSIDSGDIGIRYREWENEDQSRAAPTDTTSPLRDTCGVASTDGCDSHTSSSGSDTTGPSREGSRSTTGTATSKTTASRTSNSSTPQPTSDSTADVSFATESGGSRVPSAASSRQSSSASGTSARRGGRSTDVAASATSHASAPTITSVDFSAAPPSIFRYVAKPSRAERNAGVEGDGNIHSTVKSISLMRWLIRLVTKPGDVVLDPFGGSGTTGVAALAEGRRVILVERDPRFAEIARQRCEHVTPDMGRPVRVGPSARVPEHGADPRQLSLLGVTP